MLFFGGLERRHLGEPDDAVLGCDIGRLEGRADETMRRSDIDDAAEAIAAHDRQGEPRRVEGGRQVDRKDRVPFLDRELVDPGNVLDPRVVDENVEPAETVERLRDQVGDITGLRHVGAEVERPDPKLTARSPTCAALMSSGRPKPLSTILRAGRGERARNAEADAARRSGDQRDLAGEREGGSVDTLHDFHIHSEDLLQVFRRVRFDSGHDHRASVGSSAEISAGYRLDADALWRSRLG